MTDLTQISLEELASSFDSKGYELFMKERVPTRMSVEETIVSALTKGRARLLEGIPILLSKHKIDYKKLRELIKSYRLWNEFGYFGDFSLVHINNKELKSLVEYCRHKRKPYAKVSFLEERFFKYSGTEEEKKWNLIGAPSYSALERQYRRYCR